MSSLGIGCTTTSPAFPAPAGPLHALPRPLREVVLRTLPDSVRAFALVRDFLGQSRASPQFTARLIDAGRGTDGEPWPIRLLAARMLEWQIVAGEGRGVVERLGIDVEERELRARLGRYAFLHRPVSGMSTAPAALERFIRMSLRPCLVPLARYLFSHDEVLDRVYDQTRQSRGLRNPECDSPLAMRQALAELPPREGQLAAALAETHEIFWVGPRTPSEINSLIEYPLGTVALVIKPPGSDVEIEIKRAGIRGPRALDVIYTRNGYVVCSTHHLQGAAVGYLLEWEVGAEGRFAGIWRAIYAEPAPISRTLRVNDVHKMPLDGGGFANVIRFFNDRELYGDGYDDMRGEMARALGNLLRFEGEPPYDAPNDMALTGRFFGALRPGQAVQVGTTSFRLDRIARYLRPDGASVYFRELGGVCATPQTPSSAPDRDTRREQGGDYDRRDALGFADEMLSEILAGYVPPPSRYRTYEGYLRAAFAINRVQADHHFIECTKQIGKMFATCMALCIGSTGESFVARNVGLRCVFENGAWRVKVIFVDHDALNIAERGEQEVRPQEAARRIRDDYSHIAGCREPMLVPGCLRLLAGIYRVSPAVRRRGEAAFHEAGGEAFRATRTALRGKLSSFFHPKWIERLADYDVAMQTFLRAGRSTRQWRESIPPLLGARRQTTQAFIDQYIRGIGGFGRLWRHFPYLKGE